MGTALYVEGGTCTSRAGPVLFKDRELQEEVGLDYIIKVGVELELESKD